MRLTLSGACSALIAAGIVAATTTCRISDVLQSPGLEDVSLSFTSDTVLVVAAPMRPAVGVTVSGAAIAQARVRLASSDTSVVAVHGDTLVPKRRGGVTLTVTLESSALPRDPPTLTRSLVVVADTVTVDSTAVRCSSVGDTVTLAATARDALGAAIAGAAARWSSSDTTVAVVTANGRVAARGNGAATVRAMVDRDTAVVAVTVAQALTRWTLEPASLRLDALTATASAAATGRDARGNAIAALAPSAWSVGDATVVSVSAAGQVAALRNGNTYLYATRGAVRDSVPVTVAQRAAVVAVTPRPAPPLTSLGAQVQLIARAFDRLGVEIQSAQPAWFTPDPALVRVSDGLVTALATGSARIVASLDAVADTATVVISNVPASVAITPDSALATSLGDTLLFRAVARNGRGDSVAATFAWRTPDTAVVRLLADGRAIATATGTGRVIATAGGKSDTSLARVANVPTAIEIVPSARTYVSLGDVDTLPVTITNARGAALPRGAVTWSSDDATIARVSTGGVVTARDTGQTVVRATSGSVTDSVDVTVLNVPASIVIGGPAVDTLTAVGQALTLVVDVRNARGAPIANYPVAWFTLDPALVRVTDGLVTALATGSARIVASLDAAADTATVVISNDPVSIAIAPDSALATSLGDTLVFRAVARNDRGDPVAATLTWRTPDSTVVRLLSDGRAIATAVGTARVIVSVGGRADTGLARVTNVPVAIDIASAARTYTSLGDVDTLAVTIANARGAALPRGAVTWTSDDATIARVTSGGIVTARDTGETVVRASGGGVMDSVLVTVTNAAASVLVLGLRVDTLTALGQSLTYGVEVRNARGALIPNYPVLWRSANRAAVDTVLPTGLVVAMGWGTTHLVARAATAVDSVALTVRNPTRLYVSNAGYATPRVGTRARPYLRIQDGVEAADAADTVMVLRGGGRYSESVNLVRRITLMGDPAEFDGTPASLPLLSHDTGAYAIRAHTAAPVELKYLAITHTLNSGPALDADGSQVDVSYVAVNRPGTVTLTIGEGLRIANGSQARVNDSWIYSVNGYAVRVVNTPFAYIGNNAVDWVVATSSEDGSGIHVTRAGSDAAVTRNTVRQTMGPMIYVDSSAGVRVDSNDVANLGRMVVLSDVGDAHVRHNSFRLADVGNMSFSTYGNPWENGVVSILRPTAHVEITDNSFWGAVSSCPPVYCAVWDRDFIGVNFRAGTGLTEVGRNTFHGGTRTLVSNNEVFSTYENHADSVASYYVAIGTADVLMADGDTVRAATYPCVRASADDNPGVSGGTFVVRHVELSGCALWRGPGAIEVNSPGSHLSLTGVSVTGTPRTMTALRMRNGGNLTVDSSRFLGGTDTTSPRNDPCVLAPCGGVRAEAYSVDIRNSVISGFHGFPGLGVENSTSLALRGSVVRDNRIGVLIGEGVAVTSTGGPVVNDVFDNDSAGFSYTGTSPLTVPNEYWWGDGRGSRSGSNLAATGDTIIAANPVSLTVSAATAPGHVGTQAAALRKVRGDGQSAPASAGAALAKAFTVRVVDANGLPVAGVSVQFSVTAGGGKFGGQNNVTVVTNAGGLAEATLTPGTTPGVNTVRVSAGGGVRDLTFTATGT